MPELPEVQTVVTRLDGAVRGATIAAVALVRPDIVKRGDRGLAERLVGRRVAGVGRHGKRIIWRLEPPGGLVMHLGMTGNVSLARPDAAIERHTHLRIAFSDRPFEVRFRDPRRFGGVWLEDALGTEGRGRFSAALGPDALALGLKAFRAVLRRPRQIKALLMDQSVIAGLGNIYCDEALHRGGVHPRARACDLPPESVARLHRALRAVLRSAIEAGGSSLRDYRNADGDPGLFQIRHRVYGRDGLPCPRCRTHVVRVVLASRSTHYCPRCQPAPRTP